MKLHVYVDGVRSSADVYGLFFDSFFGHVFVVSDQLLPYKFVLSNAI